MIEIVEARGIAARCWCDDRVSDRVMDCELAEVFAEQLVDAYKRGMQHRTNTLRIAAQHCKTKRLGNEI